MLGGKFCGTSEQLTRPVAVTEPHDPGLHYQCFAADLRVGGLLGKLGPREFAVAAANSFSPVRLPRRLAEL